MICVYNIGEHVYAQIGFLDDNSNDLIPDVQFQDNPSHFLAEAFGNSIKMGGEPLFSYDQQTNTEPVGYLNFGYTPSTLKDEHCVYGVFSDKASRICIPTIQDGFPSGLDESRFNDCKSEIRGNYKLLSTNCAYAVFRMLALCGAAKYGINFGPIMPSNPMFSFGNTGFGWKSVVDIAKILRNTIIDKSLENISPDFYGIDRVKKLIQVEYLRLIDGLENLHKSSFASFRSDANKKDKIKMYEIIYRYIKQNSANLNKIYVINYIKNNMFLSGGFFCNETTRRLNLLIESFLRDQFWDKSQVQSH